MIDKKSLVSVVNITGSTKTIVDAAQGLEVAFPHATTVVVYRNQKYFRSGEFLGRLTGHLAAGTFIGYSFNGSAQSAEDSVEMANVLCNELNDQSPSYSTNYWWNRHSCLDMLDGLKKQMDIFDWTAAVKQPEDFFTDAHEALTALNSGYLDIATSKLQAVPAETEATEFFTQERKDQFIALFLSASSE